MVEDENKKSFNDFFDLQKNWKDESSVVKLNWSFSDMLDWNGLYVYLIFNAFTFILQLNFR